jgi:hypothetical protein
MSFLCCAFIDYLWIFSLSFCGGFVGETDGWKLIVMLTMGSHFIEWKNGEHFLKEPLSRVWKQKKIILTNFSDFHSKDKKGLQIGYVNSESLFDVNAKGN